MRRVVSRMQIPSLGLNEPEVKQENLATGTSNDFHFDLRDDATPPGVVTIVMLPSSVVVDSMGSTNAS